MAKHLLTGLLLAGLVAAWPVMAQDEAKVVLKYAPAANDKWQDSLDAELLDVALQGQSLGVTGAASVKLSTEVVAVDEEKNTVSLKTDFSDLKSLLNGQSSNPRIPVALAYKVDQHGEVVAVEDSEPVDQLDFIETGGVPLQLVALLAKTVRFSDEAVGVGDSWDMEDKFSVPSLGEIPINTRWTVDELTDKAVYISSKAAAVLPDFVTPNPMAPGSTMEVKAGRVYLMELKQVYDLELSRVMEVEGNLRIEAMLVMQGMQMPLLLTVRFTSDPIEAPVEPEK
jgi:hypothetical protein